MKSVARWFICGAKRAVKLTWLRFPFYLARTSVVDHRKVVFVSYSGRGYGDSGKAIAEELLYSGERLDLVWSLQKGASATLPLGIRAVKYGSLRWCWEMATARVWISNSRLPERVVKRKGQFYLMTWHSSMRLKKIERDAGADLAREYVAQAIHDSSMIDTILAGNEFSRRIFERSFWYNGPVEMIGNPRCDVLFDREAATSARMRIAEQYGLNPRERWILYAPTYRSKNLRGVSNPEFESGLKDLVGAGTFLVRDHPNTSIRRRVEPGMLDVTGHPDMQELLLAADVLITDYSGCAFDMLLRGKPCVLYVDDVEEYSAEERGLYFNLDDLPFPVARDLRELVELLSAPDPELVAGYAGFLQEIGSCESGDASTRTAQLVLERLADS